MHLHIDAVKQLTERQFHQLCLQQLLLGEVLHLLERLLLLEFLYLTLCHLKTWLYLGYTSAKVLLFIGMQREKAIIFPPFTPLFTNAHWSTHYGGGQSTETKKVADK